MKTLALNPYGFTLYFYTDYKQYTEDYFTREPNRGALPDSVAGICVLEGKGIYLGVFDDGPECLDTLAHEVQHALLDLACYIHYNPSEEQEPFAYLAGYIMKNLLLIHPKFREAMNESVGARAGNGGRGKKPGTPSNRKQRGEGAEPQ